MKQARGTGIIVFILGLCMVTVNDDSPIAGIGTRTAVMGQRGVVACGHYLAAEIGITVMRNGGNAIDAGIAMVLAQSLLETQDFGFGGEAPTLIYSARDDKVYEISGNTRAPKAATIAWFRDHGYTKIPGDGLVCAGVPALPDAVVNILDRFGTMSFEDVAEYAIDLAGNGYPMYEAQLLALRNSEKRMREEWPTSGAEYLPNDRIPELGEIVKHRDWAATMRRLVQAERNALKKTGGDRHAGLMAVRDYFYTGPIAREIVTFQKENEFRDAEGKTNHGLLTEEDFAVYRCQIGDPVSINYRGYDVYKCGPWTQGPVFLEHLNILEGYDLASMGFNSADYIHTWIEAAKLAHADKEMYYTDPDFEYVPMTGLLSKEYATERRTLIDPEKASMELRPGDPYPYDNHPENRPKDLDLNAINFAIQDHGTTGTRAIDAEGNMFSATPSGGWFTASPVIPGLGFCLGTRIQMFYLDETRFKKLEPGKRPSTSLTPSLVMKDGEPLMVFGMPGGDLQDQGTLNCFLNIVDFGMDLQEALDAPKIWTNHFPSLFYPFTAHPGQMCVESRIPNLEDVVKELSARGHIVDVGPAWAGQFSNGVWADNTLICYYDHKHGVLKAATNPRFLSSYALAW